MARTVLDELITIIGFKGDTRDLDRVQQRVKQVQSNINMMARNFAIAGAALTGVGFVVGRTILSFDRAMNTLRATFLDAPTGKLKELEEQAKRLGSETSKSATDAANAQVELARAGLSTNQVMEAIPSVLNLAIAGELDMAEAAGLVTNQLAAFNLETSETERVVDVLAKTASSARTTVSELGPAFRQVAPIASSLGVSIEETAAVIGTLRSGGLAPEQAGTAFRNILAILQEDPTDRVREGFKDLGLTFEEVSGMIEEGNLVGAIQLLGERGLSAKNALRIFGREAASGATSLARAADNVDGFVERLNAAEGTADRMRKEIEAGLPGSVEEFKSSLEGLQLELGDSGLRGLMTKALDTIRDFLRWITNAPGPLKILSVAAIAAGPVLLGLAAGLKAVSFALGGLAPLLKLARGAVWLWRNALILTRSQMGLLSAQTWWANSALSRFAATIWASTIGALRALGRRLAMASLAMLRFATRAIVAGISAVITFGAAIWASLIPPLIAATAAVVGFTIALLANPIVLLVAGIIAAFVALGFIVYKFRRQIVGALQTAWSWIKDNWPLLVGILLGPFGIVGALVWKFKDDIIGAFAAVRDFIIGAWQAVVDFIMDKFNMVKELPGKLLDAIPGGGLTRQAFTGIAGKVGKSLGLAEGGIVPGPLGRPLLATVHGGEMVLPVGASRVIAQMLEGFRLGPAALPQAPYHYGQMYRSSVTDKSVTVHIHEPIVIHTEATDAKGIAQELDEAIQDQIRNVAYDHDGPVER